MALLSRESHKMENGLQYVLTTVSAYGDITKMGKRAAERSSILGMQI